MGSLSDAKPGKESFIEETVGHLSECSARIHHATSRIQRICERFDGPVPPKVREAAGTSERAASQRSLMIEAMDFLNDNISSLEEVITGLEDLGIV